MILAAMPSPARLPPPLGGAAIFAGGSEGAGAEISVREGGGAIAAPVAVEKQSPLISWSLVLSGTESLSHSISQNIYLFLNDQLLFFLFPLFILTISLQRK